MGSNDASALHGPAVVKERKCISFICGYKILSVSSGSALWEELNQTPEPEPSQLMVLLSKTEPGRPTEDQVSCLDSGTGRLSPT